MNEAIRMQVSAFVDGELPDNEADLLAKYVEQLLRREPADEARSTPDDDVELSLVHAVKYIGAQRAAVHYRMTKTGSWGRSCG